MYEWKDDVCQIRKLDIEPIDINVMSDLQSSYRTYITTTIYDDIKYLEELIRELKGNADVTLKAHVGELTKQLHMRSQVANGVYYYPVYIDIYAGMGQQTYKLHSDVELLRIPYMDDYGRVNVHGSTKVILGVQRASDDISYDMSENTFNIAMPHANIRIQSTPKGVKVYYGKQKIALDYVIAAMLHEVGDDTTNLHDIITNTYLSGNFSLSPLTMNVHVHKMMQNNGLLQKYKSEQYALGGTRNALNESLTLNAAIGKRLSRPVLSYETGTLVTKAMVQDFVHNGIFILHVCNRTVPNGYVLKNGYAIPVPGVKAGTVNCDWLRSLLPEYKDEPVIPIDCTFPEVLYIKDGTYVTEKLIDLFISLGMLSFSMAVSKDSATTITHNLELEVISNYTARLGDVLDEIPAGRDADEWVYCYNNPTYKPTDNSHLTPHDFLAIMSVMGNIRVTGTSFLLNRDTSYLKKTLLINEILSETLCNTLKDFVKKYKNNISNFILRRSRGVNSDLMNPFMSLTHKWMSELNSEKFTAPIDAINLLAEVSQATHVSTITSKSAAIPDVMRYISMPFFGRICPFETPAGQKLGLVNTKAVGAKVINGLLCTPYRKVIATSNGIRISKSVTYLSVKEEIGYKFGDMLTFKQDANGEFINAPIVAKIPNPEVSDDPFIFATINTFDLAGGYVSAYPEQFLSTSVSCVPFACSDDPVRISYGVSQLRQAIYLHHTEKPLVTTPMYKDIFNFSNHISYTSTEDGVVESIDNMHMALRTSAGLTVVPIQSNNSIGQLDAVVEAMVSAGETVRKGQLIAKAIKYPQDFVVRAPYRCQVLGINGTNIEVMKLKEGSFTGGAIDLEKCDNIIIDNSRIIGQTATFTNLKVSAGDIVEKDEIMATTGVSPDGVFSFAKSPLVGFIMDGYNHEDGVSTCESACYDYTSVITHSITKKLSKSKYPSTRAVPLSGFSYCGDGDKVGTVVAQTTKNPEPLELSVYGDYQHKGIPFEITRDDTDSKSRVYKWYLLDFKPLKESDKMSGRHGNKGVVSKKHRNSDMPLLANGLHLDFMLNPCGVPSRMNIGQMWDLLLGLAAKVLGIRFDSPAFNGATEDDVAYLLKFAYTLANTPDIESDRRIFNSVCASFKQIPIALYEVLWNNRYNIVDWRGVFTPEGNAHLYDPITGTYFESNITIGYPYFTKLVQEGEEKMNFRSGPLSEGYSRTTSQPMKGDNSHNGQRIGEMEFMAFAAYGARAVIDECCNEKSDNVGARNNIHMKQLGLDTTSYTIPDKYCAPRSLENTLYMLEGMGVHVDMSKDICDTSFEASEGKYTYDLRKVVQHSLMPNQDSSNATQSPMDLDGIAEEIN